MDSSGLDEFNGDSASAEIGGGCCEVWLEPGSCLKIFWEDVVHELGLKGEEWEFAR